MFSISRMSVPKVAVLATGLAAAVLVATINPVPAEAQPTKAKDCLGCHVAGGSTTAAPSTLTPAGGATYTVAITLAANPAGGNSGYAIVPVAPATGAVNGGNTSAALTYSATMTAPAAAGTYTYNVYTNQGLTDPDGYASGTTYSITVGSAATTPPVTTTTTPPVTTTTVPPTSTTTTVPPVTTTTTTVPPTSTTTTVPPTSTTTTTPPTVPETNTPGAPTKVTATPGNGSATVSWDAPKDNGGLPIMGYLVISSDGEAGAITEGAETTVNVPDLVNGTSYTFTVIAFNDGRNLGSEESTASNAVTPFGPSAPAATATATDTATTPAAGAGGTAVIPVGAPDTGAGGASNTTDGPTVGLGGLALLIAGAGATLVLRRRQQV